VWPGFISESQRNLILQHHSSTVFQKNYASRYMPDTHAAYRGLEPQVAVMRAASGMSRTIDLRRPKQLTESQRAEVDRHPEIKLLFRTRTNLRALVRDRGIKKVTGTALHANYENACREYRKVRRRHQKAFLTEVKSRYKREQPVIDIQRQLRGESLDEKDPTLKMQDCVLAERCQVIDSLFTFATSSPEEECRRRAKAINALKTLCNLQEGRRFRRRTHSASTNKLTQETLPAALQPPSLSDSLPVECKPTQCIFCLGSEGLPAEVRLKSFHSCGDLKKHFQRKHLRHHPKDQPIECPHPRCKVTLDHTMHLQNHAETVHKTRT